MAVSSSTVFGNSIQGIPGIGADVDIYAADTTPKFPIGQRYTRSDGSEYVYSHFGQAGLSSGGLLVATDLSESGTLGASGHIVASASVTAISGETINPGAVGSHYVQVNGGGVVADRFAGGYLQIRENDGFGYNYRIKGNTASSAKTTGASLTYYIELYDTIQQALSPSSLYRIVGSKYANVESATMATDNGVAGVTTCSHAAATWGWIQTSGIAGCRTEASGLAVASVAYLSEEEPGCVGVSSQMRVQAIPVGVCVASATAVAHTIAAVDLRLQ